MPPVTPDAFFGVDFSGARDAGRRIWVARAVAHAARLRAEELRPASELEGGGPRRDEALEALRGLALRQRRAVFGLDFPFSVHRRLVEPWGDWAAFAQGLGPRFGGPEAFRRACASRGREVELRRACDEATPWAPHNLRLFRQTYYGISRVLAPLAEAGASVVPLHRGRGPWLLEVCPAVALARLGLRRPYKGRGAARARHRRVVVDALRGRGFVVPPGMAGMALRDRGGDALDALVAAWATWRSFPRAARLRPRPGSDAALEGVVFA